MILSCSAKIVKTIGWLRSNLKENEISRDLDFRWVSNGYPILDIYPLGYPLLSNNHKNDKIKTIDIIWFQSVVLYFHFSVIRFKFYWQVTINYQWYIPLALQWRHNGRDGVLNHQRLDRLLSRLFRRRSKETSKLRVTGLCEGNSPVTGEFPAQRASSAENGSIWWRYHGLEIYYRKECPTDTFLLRNFHV